MINSPCNECPARCGLFDLADRIEATDRDERDRIRAACRVAELGPVLEASLVGPASGGELPDDTNIDVSRFKPEFSQLLDLDKRSALLAVFRLSLDSQRALLRADLAVIDARLVRVIADILPMACEELGPRPGIRVPLFGVVHVSGMQKSKCVSYVYSVGARQIRKMNRKYDLPTKA
jgi:hypothetical protein